MAPRGEKYQRHQRSGMAKSAASGAGNGMAATS